jgi:hypothetical protein
MPTATTGNRPRSGAGPNDLGPLRLNRPAVRVLAGRRPPELAGMDLGFMTDYLSEFGARPDFELYSRGGGNGFIDLADALLDGLERSLPMLDNVLLAYHSPDLKFAEVAGCYLAERCPGDPEVASVAGQGVGAPFTSLRILDGMRRGGKMTDGAVFVLDQTTSPYPDPDVLAGQASDCGVLIWTDSAGGEEDPGADLDFIAEEQVADPNAALRELTLRLPEAVIVVGRLLAARLDPESRSRPGFIEGPVDQLCTSAWAALGEHWTPDRYMVVADYDPHSGRLFQAGLRPWATA